MIDSILAKLREIGPTVRDDIVNSLRERQTGVEFMPLDQAQAMIGEIYAAFLADFAIGNTDASLQILRPIVQQAARDNHDITQMYTTVEVTNTVILNHTLNALSDQEALHAAVRQMFHLMSDSSARVAQIYSQERDRIEADQQAMIAELSTPIVPLYAGILVVPLVGTIDSDRASNIMESLLEAIGREQADIVILDITGVPVIDTGTANYLLQAAKAARLLGSQVVLVGIGAEIAQTMVQLGIDMNEIVTRANLQSGIEYALEQFNLRICPVEESLAV